MKKDFDRRDVLKGLVMVPGAAALGAWLQADAQRPTNKNMPAAIAAAKPTMNFNVILHGTFALELDIKKNKASVLIPRVLNGSRDAHVYKAGPFREEGLLDSSKEVIDFNLPLDQANPLPPVLTANPGQFAIVRNSQLARADGGPLRNIFQFPFPHGLEVGLAQIFNESGHKFFNNTTFANQPVSMPLTLVLRYSLASGGAQLPPFNFHIYAQADGQSGHHPVTTAFAALTSLYKDVGKLELTQDVTGDVSSSKKILVFNNQINLPSDLLDDEVLSLEDRDLPFGGSHVGTCAGLILING
jgi:hypothetical protein